MGNRLYLGLALILSLLFVCGCSTVKKTATSADEYVAREQARRDSLEISEVEERELGPTKSYLKEARKLGAENYAPNSLSEARWSLAQAEAMIARNPRNRALFADRVAHAKSAARTLKLIMVAAHKNSQQSLAQVRDRFSQDEAEIYRLGDKLLIRLKNMSLKKSGSTLQPGTERVLVKVKSVLGDVKAQDVVVKSSENPNQVRAVARFLEDQSRTTNVKTVSQAGPNFDLIVTPRDSVAPRE